MSMDQTPEETPKNTEATRGEHPEGLEKVIGEVDGNTCKMIIFDAQEAAGQQDSIETQPQIEFYDNTFDAAWRKACKEAEDAIYYGSTPPNEILKNEDGSVTLIYDDHAITSRTMTLEEAKMRFPEHFDQPTNKMVNLQEKKRMEDFQKMLTTPDPDLAKRIGDTLYGNADKTRNVKVWIVGPNAKREWDAALKKAMSEGSEKPSKEDLFPLVAQMFNAAYSLQVEGDRKEVTEANLTNVLGNLLYCIDKELQRSMFEIFFANLKKEDQAMFDDKLGHIQEYKDWRNRPTDLVWMPYSHYLVEEWFRAGRPGFDKTLHSNRYPNE